jgi:hypothetical protein
VLLLSLGIRFWRHAQRRRPASALLIIVIFVVRAERQLLVFLLLFAPLPFAKRDMARAAPIALRHRARGSKFSRRPQRSYSIGVAKLVSHVCDSACSEVRRHTGSGWRRGRMKFLALM